MIQQLQLVQGCICPDLDELKAENFSVAVNPTKFPNGTPLHSSQSYECKAMWINVQAAQTLSAYLGFGGAIDMAGCIEIAPGGKEFLWLPDDVERLVSSPRRRIRPYFWKVNSTAAMSVAVMCFL